MDQYQIKGWRNIDGSLSGGDRMPDSRENFKIPVWINQYGSHVYKTLGEIINNVEIELIEDDYLTSVSRQTNGNYALFTMNKSATKTLELGALAWLNEIPSLTLPGITRVLFHDTNDIIGGEQTFLFDKVNKEIKLSSVTLMGNDPKFDTNYSPFLQYLYNSTNPSVLINGGYKKVISTGNILSNVCAFGKNSIYNLKYGSGIVAIGNDSARSLVGTSNNILRGVFLGAYAGEHENCSRKLYIDDQHFNNLSVGRSASLIYGDFGDDYLHLNGKVYIKEDVRIGDWSRAIGTAETVNPDYGTLAMTSVEGGDTFVDGNGITRTIVRPRYWNGIEWKYFDGTDTYLEAINVGTELEYNETTNVEFVVNGRETLNLQLGSNAFTSTPIKSAHGDDTRIQLSTGPNSEIPYSFISYDGLTFDHTNNILNVSRALKLPMTDFSTSAAKVSGTFITAVKDGKQHAYCYLDGNYIQLDNEGEYNGGSFGIENIGDSYEIYAELQDNGNFGFRTLTPGEAVNISYYSSTGGTTWRELLIDLKDEYKGLLVRSVDDSSTIRLYKTPANNSERVTELFMRKLKSTNNSITFDVTTDPNYIDIQYVGASVSPAVIGGNNLGTGIGVYKNVLDNQLIFKTLVEGTYGAISQNEALTEIILSAKGLYSNVNETIVENYISLITSNSILSDNTKSLTVKQLKGITPITVANNTENGGIDISFNAAIPSITFNTNPQYNDVTKLFNIVCTLDTNILDGTTPASNNQSIFAITLGDKLIYDPISKVLNAVTGTGIDGDIYIADVIGGIAPFPTEIYGAVGDIYGVNLVDGIVNQSNSSRRVGFIKSDSSVVNFDGFGFLAFQDKYQDADINTKGIVEIGANITVNDGVISVAPATTNTLGVIKIGSNLNIDGNGVLSGYDPVDCVIYNDVQYSIHDNDSFNSSPIITSKIPGIADDTYTLSQRINRRLTARSNIGAAYVNGNNTENFNAYDYIAARRIYAPYINSNTSEFDSDTSQIQSILFKGSRITTTAPNSGVYLSKRALPNISPTSIGVLQGDINIAINTSKGTGNINIYDITDEGVVSKMFRFDTKTGDLYCRGSIYMGGTFKYFDNDIENKLGA